MAKKKTSQKRFQQDVPPANKPQSGSGMHALRETIESIVIAFVLAFLFRTFEAEAFVIPTGSMSPSLLGRHKDVDCSECGYRFRVSASEEEGKDAQGPLSMLNNPRASRAQKEGALYELSLFETACGTCPMCRQVMPLRSDLSAAAPKAIDLNAAEDHPSYPGDRILVNKYGYTLNQPERWDVVVFKFPGNGEMNYIKRLVGLPNEEVQIYQGDLFTRPSNSSEAFRIERKPADKVAAMLQPVHDTEYQSALLARAGWPMRWQAAADGGWQVETTPNKLTVEQRFSIEPNDDAGQPGWLRYRNMIPSIYDWGIVRSFQQSGSFQGISKQQWLSETRPQLIVDFNSYNTNINRNSTNQGGWQLPQGRLGKNWVSDLAVEFDVQVDQPQGELLLDLVEGGRHFQCRIQLETGQATLGIEGFADFKPTASTALKSKGNYALRFANVDDRLLFWIDEKLVDFGDTTYDVEQLFGNRRQILPRTSAEDPGDLAPVGIGAQNASLSIERIKVLRDIYYIAASTNDRMILGDYIPAHLEVTNVDGQHLPKLQSDRQLLLDPETWPRFLTRRKRQFTINQDQFFVMGDNSPSSQDCRLWSRNTSENGIPGGAYLDRQLLTGKAVCVFWPHSWGGIPGLNKLPGFPNFGDMRIVR